MNRFTAIFISTLILISVYFGMYAIEARHTLKVQTGAYGFSLVPFWSKNTRWIFGPAYYADRTFVRPRHWASNTYQPRSKITATDSHKYKGWDFSHYNFASINYSVRSKRNFTGISEEPTTP